MTVGKLKKELDGVADDVIVMAPTSDHSLTEVHCAPSTGLRSQRGSWNRDYGELMTPESEYGKRTKIFLVCSDWS